MNPFLVIAGVIIAAIGIFGAGKPTPAAAGKALADQRQREPAVPAQPPKKKEEAAPDIEGGSE